MSKICIGVICSANITVEFLNCELLPLLECCGLAIFYGLSYDEPLIRKYDEKEYIVFSIADNYDHDNCEMLLLPDNCMFNHRVNSTSFKKRMQYVERILRKILETTRVIDLFIGDSGTNYDEFAELYINIDEFLTVSEALNSITAPDLHFVLQGRWDGSLGPRSQGT